MVQYMALAFLNAFDKVKVHRTRTQLAFDTLIKDGFSTSECVQNAVYYNSEANQYFRWNVVVDL